MKKQYLKIALVSIMAACFFTLVMGKVATAQAVDWSQWGWSAPSWQTSSSDNIYRGAQAYEKTEYQGPEGYSVNIRQYTSEYDLMNGEIYPEVDFSYTVSTPWAASNPLANMLTPRQTSGEGSAVGGYFSGPMISFPTMTGGLANMFAPRYQYQTTESPFGSSAMMWNMPGAGGGGFAWSPFGNNTAYSYGGGYGYGGYGGGYPNVIY